MKRYPKIETISPANDNAPIRVGAQNTAENTSPSNDVLHLYVQNAHQGATSDAVPGADAPIRETGRRTVIMSNLPEQLPILAEEIALVQSFMADLVSQIIANDNEPT